MRSVVLFAFLTTVTVVITNAVAAEEKMCLGKTETATKLDFLNSKLTRNDLHVISKNGKNEGMMKFDDIGIVRDQSVDLVVTVVPGTTYTTKKGNKRNGKGNGLFGNINMMTYKNDEKFDGEGNFEFCFYDKQDELVIVDSFRWSFYDLDERGDDKKKQGVGIKEMLIMDTSQIVDYSVYPNRKDSEIDLVCENSGKTPTDAEPCNPGERTQFKSSTAGEGEDNPSDPNNLTEVQKKRSITYTFQNKSCFQVTFSHYCPVDNCRWYGGGNFMFSGDAEQLIVEGECITSAPIPTAPPTNPPSTSPTNQPTKTPTTTPTKNPTTTPTKNPTNSPTNSPTNAPTNIPTPSPTIAPVQTDPPTQESSLSSTGLSSSNLIEHGEDGDANFFLPPQICPDDIKLVMQHGAKDFLSEIGTEQPVKILSQDTSTVTVQLDQVWTSPLFNVDAIYYKYKEDLYNVKCYEERDVKKGITYAEEVTIQCNLMSPRANLQICVVDSIDKGFLGVDDNGTVPKCCHSDKTEDTPVVCYSLEINCNTVCTEEADSRRQLTSSSAGLRGSK